MCSKYQENVYHSFTALENVNLMGGKRLSMCLEPTYKNNKKKKKLNIYYKTVINYINKFLFYFININK